MYHKFAYVLVIGAFTLGLAACGGGNRDNSNSPASVSEQTAKQDIVIKASSWEFDQPAYVVPKDTPVKIILENTKGAHGIKVDGTDIKLGPGRESTVVTLKAGTYDFHCSIQCGTGHTKMASKLIVK